MMDKNKIDETKTSLKEKIGRGYMAFARRSYESRNIWLDLMAFWKESSGWYKVAIIFRLILFVGCIYGAIQLSASVGWFFLYLLGFMCLAGALIYGIDTVILNWTYGSRREFFCQFVSKSSEEGDHVKTCETPEDLSDYKYRDTIVEEEMEKINKNEKSADDADPEEEEHKVEVEA